MEGTTRKCPYCAEEIPVEAVRCSYCRSRLTLLDPERWHRDHPERRLAGVASAMARAFATPVGIVRVGFIVLTFFHLIGPILYLALWLIIPFRPGEESPLERGLVWVKDQVEHLWSGRPSGRHPGPPAGPGPGDTSGTSPLRGSALP